MLSNDRHVPSLLVATAVLFSQVGSARASYCVDNGYGYEECSALSPGARVGIGIAIAVVGLLLLLAVGMMRRRRLQKTNLAYVNNPQGSPSTGPPGYYPSQAYNPQYPQYPQYPPVAHGYDPRGGFAPPYQSQQPPRYSPPMSPPDAIDKTRLLSEA